MVTVTLIMCAIEFLVAVWIGMRDRRRNRYGVRLCIVGIILGCAVGSSIVMSRPNMLLGVNAVVWLFPLWIFFLGLPFAPGILFGPRKPAKSADVRRRRAWWAYFVAATGSLGGLLLMATYCFVKWALR